MKEFIGKFHGWLVLFGIFLLYILTAPYTVQTGDTGELVTNSYFLRVSHPPGYPLWTILYHLPVRYLPFLQPFHSAAILTAFISCIALGLLFVNKNSKEVSLVLLVWGTSLYQWRYSILPDVFALHLLFLSLVFLVFMKPELLNKWWVIFLVSLSVANHHTIVFFFPLYLYAIAYEFSWRKAGLSLLFGLLSGSLYFALLLFHPEEYGSWGHLQSFSDVIQHFLRTEYGTFSLAPVNMGNSSWSVLIPELIFNYWSVLIILGFIIFNSRESIIKNRKRLLILLISFVLYLIVFNLFGSIPLKGLGLNVIERFLLQPILTVFFACLVLFWNGDLKLPRWALVLLLINSGLNINQNFISNNYRANTAVEDFAFNAFKSLPENAVYHAIGDTHNGATYYLHEVKKVRPDVVLLFTSANFFWGYEKTKLRYPDLFQGKNRHLYSVIDLNKYTYFTNAVPTDLISSFEGSFYGAIYNYHPHTVVLSETGFNCGKIEDYIWRERPKITNLNRYDSANTFDSTYGLCNYSKGLYLMNQGEPQLAILEMEKAAILSPLSVLIRERLCHFYEKASDMGKLESCNRELENLVMNADPEYYSLNR